MMLMFKTTTLCRWVCVAALALALNLGVAGAFAAEGDLGDLKGTPNPDSGNISGASGAQTIKVKPRNDAGDYKNLQWAFDNAASGGTVELDAGTFFLGDGKEGDRRTVIMRKGLRIVGKKEGDTWRTVIRGGGALINPGVGPIESGPIRVINESDSHPAVFEGIWFREWSCEVIFVQASPGFVMRNCRLSHPVNTAKEGPMRYVHALWSTGTQSRGDFIVEDNLVEMGNYTDGLPDDEQLLGVFYANHDTIRVVNNVIIGVDEAIEIIGNRIGQGGGGRAPSEIIVTGNRIEVNQNLGDKWAGTFAILIAGNVDTKTVRIEDNDITVRGKGWAFGLSGENLNVTGNSVRFEKLDGVVPAGAVYIGFSPLFGRSMGASIIDSVFENNTFEGAVKDYGILFVSTSGNVLGGTEVPNESHGNRFDLGDSLANLGAETTIAIGKGVHDNVFTGNTGKVDDKSPKGANDY